MQDVFKTIPELFSYIKNQHANNTLMYYRQNNNWNSLSCRLFTETVIKLAFGLKTIGVISQQKIGIISNPSPFWVMADFAISLSGGVSVPIFRRISPENLAFELADADLEIVFIGDPAEYEPVKIYGKKLKRLITIGFKKDDAITISFDELINLGSNVLKNEPSIMEKTIATPAENDLFTIIYTSGSTGRPKGVMLTHLNLISQIKDSNQFFGLLKNRDIALSSLPLSHIFERMVMLFYLYCGIPVYFVDEINNIGNLIREVRPTIMTVVPRLLEKVYEKMHLSVDELKGFKKKIGQAALKRIESMETNERFHGIKDWIYQKLIYRKFYNALGGRFRYIISGAASLNTKTAAFFSHIGLTIVEGYGMTEASPVIAANRPDQNKIGTVGKPFPSVTVKLAEDGEILAKGPNVMIGYYQNPEETIKALDNEGYLHTGDLGSFDADGFLKIIGRKKELFKKSTGEYVPPVPIEQELSKLDIVDHAMIIAEGRKFVSCLLFPDFEAVQRLMNQSGYKNMTINNFLDSAFIKSRVQDYINEMNRHLHHTEEVQKFTIIKQPISIETGELTPTMKLQRHNIENRFNKEIEWMYAAD